MLRRLLTRAIGWQGVTLTLLVFALLRPAAAHAAVHADFNGDGVLDTLRLDATRPHGSQLSLELSGAAPTHLVAIEDQLVSIAAADIDRDGRDDVVAASRRR